MKQFMQKDLETLLTERISKVGTNMKIILGGQTKTVKFYTGLRAVTSGHLLMH